MHAPAPFFDILTIGEVNVDLILGHDARPIFGQFERVIDDATLTVGGSGTIFAMGAAQLGLRVAYCGVVGDDFFGRFMLDHLHTRHIDTRGIRIDPSLKTGLSVILNVQKDGVPDDRAILTHLGAIDALCAEEIDATLLAQARHIHITSYFLQHNLRPGLAALLTQVRAAGTTVSLDTNWDPSERWDDGLHDLLAQTDLFLPNAQEACAITRTATLDEALDTLAATIDTVAIKNGAQGATCRRGDQVVRHPGFPISVVDTTGAGDSFNGGFLYGWLRGWPLADALELGCACGTLSTQAAGGVSAQPTLAQAQAFIQDRRASAP